MKVKLDTLKRLIREEIENILDAETLEDVEPEENAWAGGDNLELPLDHSVAGGGEPTTTELEVSKIVEMFKNGG